RRMMAHVNSSTNKALKDAFSEYRSDPRRRFHVKIRRERARQLRELLSEPDTVDLKTFNSDVWIWSNGVYLNGEKIKPAAFDNADQEQVTQYESALDSGELELHGNLIWSPPTRIYGAMLGVDDEQKMENVRAALRFLNDAELSPPQKARRVQTVAGFGPATATGLVMIFHPDEFAIYNKQSKGAMEKLGRDESTLEDFERQAADLKEILGAADYLELDHFLLHINQCWIKVPGEDMQNGTDHHEGTARDPLNLILYGPPGTGKTYSVQREAVRILEPNSSDLPDEEINQLYREYRAQGRIEFVTFHPSYSYEEFVEGFRYDEDAKIPVRKDGVFKLLADRAFNPRSSPTPTEGTRIWKVSLGGGSEQHIFERCIQEGEIAVGWLGDENLEELDRDGIAELFAKHGQSGNRINSVNYLVNEIRDGDYVAVLKNNREIRAIGVVTGPYQYKGEEYGSEYPHIRPVEWLDREDHDIYEMNERKRLVQQAIFPLARISLQEFLTLLPEEERSDEPHVLIIDEVNRGNISRIFGELITLLEEDKRRGASNEIIVRLPYSREAFAVPKNLYVIGTMNTADRSIALLDVALRRRFAFKEIMPDVAVVREHLLGAIEADPKSGFGEDEVALICGVFEELNRRVRVLVDRDHQIGHSYFMEVISTSMLHDVLYRKIFPLLQEYFYNDQRRLKLLLGVCNPDVPKGFVHSLESEYRRVYGEDPLEDEAPWEFYEYPDHQLIDVLRNTFLTEG
ncbi:MAG: hypothetical protein AVDCRST_MAG93-6632, partial [uncultured Chloroflexia bacterium]